MIKWILGGLLLIVGGIVGVSLLRGADTPPAPKLPKAGAAASGELAGTLRPAAGSFVGYRVDETLIGIGLNTAVGRTDEVRGSAGVGIDLVGSIPIEFSDYGMEPPSVAGVASVRDHGVMEVRLRLR